MQRMMNPADLSVEEIKKLCGQIRQEFKTEKPPEFLYRKEFNLSSNLILDTEYDNKNNSNQVRYFVTRNSIRRITSLSSYTSK